MASSNHFYALLGRIFLATVFLASAFGKITNFEGTVQYMAAHGIPMANYFCVAAMAFEIVGGLSLVLGFYARWGTILLIVFLIPTTLVFHWGAEQRIQFLKNLAILGGLMQLLAFGPGELSLDDKTH